MSSIPIGQVVRMYDEGKSVRAICRSIGVPETSHESLRSILVRNGVQIRTVSQAARFRKERSPEELFWRHVQKTDGCWEWIGGKNQAGYGEFSVRLGLGKRKRFLAHVFSYKLANGEFPEGLKVCHTCDNPPCVRPDHLFKGTQADNVKDAVSKGRVRFGEKHGMAKLSREDVIEIRRRYALGSVSQLDLGKEFGITGPHISEIVNFKTWRK